LHLNYIESKSRLLQQSYNFGGLKKLMISSIAVLGAELHETAIVIPALFLFLKIFQQNLKLSNYALKLSR
jgi:hypothetical protein